MEKQKNKIVIVLLGGIIVILSVLCILFATGTISFNSGNVNDDVVDEDVNDKNLISKIDSSKEWIYDAEYEKNVNADSYETNFDIYYAKDINVPFINIDSSYANLSNIEIKKVFEEAIKEYNKGVEDKWTYVDECGYKKYVSDELLSVILAYGVGATGIVHPEYYVYNVDLKTGNQLSYEEIYKIAGFNSDNIDSKVESAIVSIVLEKLKDYGSNVDVNGYINESINNYKDSVSDNTLKYFLSDTGKLNVIVRLNLPFDRGYFDTVIAID